MNHKKNTTTRNRAQKAVLLALAMIFAAGCSVKPMLIKDELRVKEKTVSFYMPKASFSVSFQDERTAQALGGLIGLGIAMGNNKWRRALVTEAAEHLNVQEKLLKELTPKLAEKYKFQVVEFSNLDMVTNAKLYKNFDGKGYGPLPKPADAAMLKAEYLGYLKANVFVVTDGKEDYYSAIELTFHMIDKTAEKLVWFKKVRSDYPIVRNGMTQKEKTASFTGDNVSVWEKVIDQQVKDLAEKIFDEDPKK